MASSSFQQEKCNHGDDTRNIVLKKGTWSNEEDQLLREYVTNYGVGKWDSVRKKTTLARDGKSCRLRWLNHLKPTLKKCSLSEEEGRKLIYLYNELGPKWTQMLSQFHGRTDNELKNFINSKKRSLKNSRKQLVRESIHHVDELKDNVGEISMMRGSSNQQNNASQEEEIALPRVEFDHQEDILHGNYLDQSYDEKNNEEIIMRGSSNHSNNACQEEELTLPRVEFNHQDIMHGNYLDQVNDEKNINNLEQLSTMVDQSYDGKNNEKIIMRSSTNHNNNACQEEELTLTRGEFSLQHIMHGNMFFDQYCPYNLDMDYQYLQNPILSSEEPQYEILEPMLLSQCVPFWEP
ncbi:unnamed protein product [Lathyrus sativus]|nr:unnamed protein product [Lathyrus sativus]